jgi:2-dehydropantoate 2-reductase
VLQVAHRSGITSPELTDAVAESIIQDTKDRCGHSNPEPSQFRPSMLVDLENSRPLEVEVIVGGIMRAAEAVDVKTPRYVSIASVNLE